MTPAMQKILEEFDKKFTLHDAESVRTCKIIYQTPKAQVELKEFVQRACVEYAKSIIQTPVQVILIIKDPIMQERWDGVIKKIVDSFEEQIQQDSLDLPTNS